MLVRHRSDESLLGSGPRGCGSHHDTTCESHGAGTGSALEKGSRKAACRNSTIDVVLATNTIDGGVNEVVDEGNDTGGIAEEGTSSGDLIQNSVQSKTESGVFYAERAEEAFPCTEETTDGETGEVGCTCTVAKVV